MTTRMPERLAHVALLLGSVLLVGACAADRAAEDGGTDTTTASGEVERADAPRPMAAPNAAMQAVLDELQALGGKPITTLRPAEARRQPTPADAAKRLMLKQGKPATPDPAVASMDRTIPGPAGALSVRIYTPRGGAGRLPVVVYYHGGGWVIADRNVYDAGARAISKLANAIVVSVDYRQGPEHRFPAAHDDAIATYAWVVENAASIGGDPARVALAGESAGGGLAVATAIAARDRQMSAPSAVIAVYPIAGTDTTTPAYVENAQAKPLSRAMMSWFFQNYLDGPQDRDDPRLNLVAADLRGLPPTTIINAQIDPLRSDGELLAERLRAAGVEVQQRSWNGVTHEFFGMGAVLDEALQAQQWAADALKRAFGIVAAWERPGARVSA